MLLLIIKSLQVFVAAALMEYYCSKDKNIAFRIFELGLKKFASNPQYVLCYIDYLSHLNGIYFIFLYLYNLKYSFISYYFLIFVSFFSEDNNTRVLFERVLTSGSLEPEKSVYV